LFFLYFKFHIPIYSHLLHSHFFVRRSSKAGGTFGKQTKKKTKKPKKQNKKKKTHLPWPSWLGAPAAKRGLARPRGVRERAPRGRENLPAHAAAEVLAGCGRRGFGRRRRGLVGTRWLIEFFSRFVGLVRHLFL
jgi:hypothetical protein